jgi:lipid-A-disaccharide synthase
MVIAGEASGDLHAAELIRCLLRMEPQAQVFGLGGKKLGSAGVELMGDIGELAVIGIWEVIGRTGLFVRLFLRLRDAMREKRPDLVILIDFPDFNLMMARQAKRMGIRVFYYISPQVWAWRARRIRQIRRCVDRIAVVFPFEVPLYEQEGVQADFVGHPLVDMARATRDKGETMKLYGLHPEKKTVALLPGSRRKELDFHLPPLLDAGRIMQEKGCQLILPIAHTLTPREVEDTIAHSSVSVRIVPGDVYNVLEACDVALVASGTATLETALMEKPMVIIYKLSCVSYWIARRLIRVPSIGLVNIVAGERIVPELTQNEVEGSNIAFHAFKILGDAPYREQIVQGLKRVRNLLGPGGASEKAARIARELLN